MAYKMFSVGLVVLAFVGMSLCQPQQQLNAGLSPQYSQSAKPQESSGALPQQSQFYQDAVQQQNLAQSYQTPFENTPNSFPGKQDSQQYYVPTTQQSAAPQIITKESYSDSLPTVIPTSTSEQVQPHYRPQFATPTQTLQDISAVNAAQAEKEYRHQHLVSIAQAQAEYKQQLAALEQAQQVLNHQFAAPVQAQQELKQQSTVLAQAQQQYKQQFSALEQAQKEYKQQFAALNEAQQELKQQFAAPVQAQQELIQQSTVLAQAQHEFTKQFSALAQAQKEYKQQFADLAQAQLEFKQQFAALIQAQKELKQQFVTTHQIPHEYKQRFISQAQQVYKQQYAVPAQGRQDYRQRFIVPTPTYQYIQKSTTATASGPTNYLNVAEYPASQIKSQTVASVQPKFKYATITQQYQPQQQYYYTVPTGQITVSEQPRAQQSETNQPSSGLVISTTTSPLNEPVVYKSASTPTPGQQAKVANSNHRIIA